jgi:hypothetical protein
MAKPAAENLRDERDGEGRIRDYHRGSRRHYDPRANVRMEAEVIGGLLRSNPRDMLMETTWQKLRRSREPPKFGAVFSEDDKGQGGRRTWRISDAERVRDASSKASAAPARC